MIPIILHPHELAALQAGRLSQIRRPVEPQPEHRDNHEVDGGTLLMCDGDHGKSEGCDYRPFATCPLGAPGSRLRMLVELTDQVCELCGDDTDTPRPLVWDGMTIRCQDCWTTGWAVGGKRPGPYDGPAKFHSLEVVSVRVERLIDIELDDLEKIAPVERLKAESSVGLLESTAMLSWYAGVWDDMHPDHPWNSNPWIWVAEVKEVSR